MHTPGEATEALDWSRFVGAQQAAFQARGGVVWPGWRNRRQRDQLANAPVACFRREWFPSLGNALSHRHLWPFLSDFTLPGPTEGRLGESIVPERGIPAPIASKPDGRGTGGC